MAKPQTDEKGQLVVRGERGSDKGKNKMVALVERMAPEIKRALPAHVDEKRMTRIVITALRTTPKLMQCDPASFLGSVMSAAQLGLEPNTPLGHCYLVPFKTTCQLMIGYQGMLDIARRSGLVTSIWGHVVREGDYFEWELGLEPKMVHKPSNLQDREDKAITHVYAAARMKGGDTIFDVLTKAQVDKRRKRSRASGSGPWVTDYEAMAVKTAVRALWKWLPKSAEMAKAAAIDEAPEIGEQSDAWDAEVTEALEKEGIAAEVDITDGEFVNEETGEVLS